MPAGLCGDARDRLQLLVALAFFDEFGGLGLSMVDHGLFAEAVGRSPLGMTVFGTQAPDAGNIEILHKYGTEEQKDRWLRPLVAGEIRSCFSMTEPETAGSNPVLLAATAVSAGIASFWICQPWAFADGRAPLLLLAAAAFTAMIVFGVVGMLLVLKQGV